MKMVIIIVAGVLVLALGGAFAMMKMMGGSSGEKAPAEGGRTRLPGMVELRKRAGNMVPPLMPTSLPTWIRLSSTSQIHQKFVTSGHAQGRGG